MFGSRPFFSQETQEQNEQKPALPLSAVRSAKPPLSGRAAQAAQEIEELEKQLANTIQMWQNCVNALNVSQQLYSEAKQEVNRLLKRNDNLANENMRITTLLSAAGELIMKAANARVTEGDAPRQVGSQPVDITTALDEIEKALTPHARAERVQSPKPSRFAFEPPGATDEPIEFSMGEGKDWKPWSEYRALSMPMPWGLRYADGCVWDCTQGCWR